jgi:hypothetical protein
MRDTRLPLSGSLMYRQPIPDQLADVKLVIDDAGAASRMPPYRCINPRATLGAGNGLSIQVAGNGARKLAYSEFAEDAPDDRCLGLVDLALAVDGRAGGVIALRHVVAIAETAASFPGLNATA